MAAAESSACGRGNAVNPSGVVLVQLRPTLPDIIRPTYYIVHVFINQLALSSYYDVHIMVAIFSDKKIIKRFTHRSGYLHINADKRQDDIFDTQTGLTSETICTPPADRGGSASVRERIHSLHSFGGLA